MVDFSACAPILDAARLGQGPHGGASLDATPNAGQFIFRGSASAALAAGRAFGVDLPVTACRATQSEARSALWLGPDEWLLLAPADQAAAIQAAVLSGVGDTPYSLVSVSHRNAAITISGPHAASVLNAGCPLDLHETAFPTAMCTRTIMAKASIILWRTAPDRFYVNVWRSFMPYLWDYLVEARTRL